MQLLLLQKHSVIYLRSLTLHLIFKEIPFLYVVEYLYAIIYITHSGVQVFKFA